MVNSPYFSKIKQYIYIYDIGKRISILENTLQMLSNYHNFSKFYQISQMIDNVFYPLGLDIKNAFLLNINKQTPIARASTSNIKRDNMCYYIISEEEI